MGMLEQMLTNNLDLHVRIGQQTGVKYIFSRHLCGLSNEAGVCIISSNDARWSSPVAREAHNLEVVSSNLARATSFPIH